MSNVFGVSGQTGVKPLKVELVARHIPIDPNAPKMGPLAVKITHEPFEPWVTLTFNGQTEELEHTEALEWFKERGMRTEDQWTKVNNMINHAMNFGEASVTIKNPTQRPRTFNPVDPLI